MSGDGVKLLSSRSESSYVSGHNSNRIKESGARECISLRAPAALFFSRWTHTAFASSILFWCSRHTDSTVLEQVEVLETCEASGVLSEGLVLVALVVYLYLK